MQIIFYSLHSRIAGELVYLPKDASLPITLKSREFEVFTVVPVKEFGNGARLAPVGLIEMFNSGGAIKDIEYDTVNGTVELKVRGCGKFGAYASVRPKRILVDSKETEFSYDGGRGLVTLHLQVPAEELYQWSITFDL